MPAKGGRNPHGACLLRPIRTAWADLSAAVETLLQRQPGIRRIGLIGLRLGADDPAVLQTLIELTDRFEGARFAAVNAHASQLNARLFSYMDYAVVGRR